MAQRVFFDGARIPVGALRCDVGRAVQIGLGKAKITQGERRFHRDGELIQGPTGRLAAEYLCDGRQKIGCGGLVIGYGMGQDDGMSLCMGQVEAAAQSVAKLVMQRHADRPQNRAAKPGAVQRFAARLQIVRVVQHTRQRVAERTETFKRHQS